MRSILIVFCCFILSLNAKTQDSLQQKLLAFENLIGGKWVTAEKWTNGGQFKQEILFEWGLNRKMIKTTSYGFIDQKTKTFGLRNEGVRVWDKNQESIRFWEFDTYGGITEGVCIIDGENISYHYQYPTQDGVLHLTDAWTKVDDNTYDFKVGILEKGEWKQIFLQSKFVRKP